MDFWGCVVYVVVDMGFEDFEIVDEYLDKVCGLVVIGGFVGLSVLWC